MRSQNRDYSIISDKFINVFMDNEPAFRPEEFFDFEMLDPHMLIAPIMSTSMPILSGSFLIN